MILDHQEKNIFYTFCKKDQKYAIYFWLQLNSAKQNQFVTTLGKLQLPRKLIYVAHLIPEQCQLSQVWLNKIRGIVNAVVLDMWTSTFLVQLLAWY